MPAALLDKPATPAAPAGTPLAQKLFIALFCGVLGLSFPLFNLFSRQLSMDNHENRLLTTLPAVLQSPLRELPSQLDAFLADNSPFRYQLVVLDASIDYKLFGTSQSDQVIPGKDGWLFYREGPTAAQPLASSQGLACINDDEATLAEASAGLQILHDRLAEAGCTLVLDLTPSKDRIYREYLPDGYPLVNEENRTDRLAAYMTSHTTVPVNWRYADLRSLARLGQPLYYRADTHWTPVGALVGLDGIFEALGMTTLPTESYTLQEGPAMTCDMANVAALYMVLPEERQLIVADYADLYPQDSRVVGVIGDSFSEYYMPYLDARFAGAWRLHIDDFDPGFVENPGCDLLILEVNERNLNRLLEILDLF